MAEEAERPWEDWPQGGDQLFSSTEPDCQHNAWLGQPYGDIARWSNYFEGYRIAADLAAVRVVEQDHYRDTLAYPVVFLYRHHFELALTNLIVIGKRLYDENWPVPNHHRLLELWNPAREALERTWPGDPEPLDRTERALKELAAHDPGSFSLRYPVDTKGQERHPDLDMMNVRHFALMAGRVSNFLTTAITGLWETLGQKEDYLSDLRSMMDYESGY